MTSGVRPRWKTVRKKDIFSMRNNGYLDMRLLRFTTAGSVDDGKSTLIGRLLYDSKSIFEDQLEAVEEASRSRGNEEVNLALLTDGLKAEREQGITIDVAYRYFATPRRKFIIADTPGHIQYTRNMVTGASTADLAIILIDARHGVVEQTVRHSWLASLLEIKRITVCVNKMDLVDFSEEVFEKIKEDFMKMSAPFLRAEVNFIPISAKLGDNVVEKSSNMPWHKGVPLLEFLETVEIPDSWDGPFRMSVQYVVRPISSKWPDFRGYAGRICQGSLQTGDEVVVLPSGLQSRVTEIRLGEKILDKALAGESVTVSLADDIDISRGDILVAAGGNMPQSDQVVNLNVCWFRSSPLVKGKRYVIRHATQETVGIVKSIEYKINVSTRDREYDCESLGMNDIARVVLKTADPLIFEYYKDNRTMGSLIFIDPGTNDTTGAGMIVPEEF